jgi:hypothetical protein
VHRMAGTRGAQLRQICNDLKRICQHPFMLMEFEPDRPEPSATAAAPGSAAAAEAAAAEAEYLSALLASSAKLQLLDTMLVQLHGQGKQVMVMANSPRVSPVVWKPSRWCRMICGSVGRTCCSYVLVAVSHTEYTTLSVTWLTCKYALGRACGRCCCGPCTEVRAVPCCAVLCRAVPCCALLCPADA